MTWKNAPLAVDGARLEAHLLRLVAYATGSGAEGIVTLGDLKVLPLAVPGNGIRISDGNALVLNRYQDSPNQTYAVANPGEDVVDSSQMPPANAAARSHLVCVTVGDPEFSQVGHPWMPATGVPVGEEETFQYVRTWIIPNVPASTKRFSDLGLNYPAYAVARLDVPANTTTIEGSMIVDLRKLALPRSLEEIQHISTGGNNSLNGAGFVAGAWEGYPASAYFDIDIPEWAVRAKITGFLEGVRLFKEGAGKLRVGFVDGGATEVTNIDESVPPPSGYDRRTYNVGGEIYIPAAYRGTTRRIRMEGTPNADAWKGFLVTDANTSAQIRVRLEEAPD